MHQDIVEVQWLSNHPNYDSLVILDVSPLSMATRPSYQVPDEYIPGALKVDIKTSFSDTKSHLPNTFPSVESFEKTCHDLGITNKSQIIIYDSLGVYTAPRIWWLFKVMGHDSVSVLNGGLTAWKKEAYKTVVSPRVPNKKSSFKANLQREYCIKYSEVLQNLATNSFKIIDARSAGRFKGIDQEPRKTLQSGHIPDSLNIPYKEVLSEGKYKDQDELRNLFGSHFSTSDQLVYSCGSGITACIVLLACYNAFNQSLYVFDGSWTEFATRQGLTK